MARLEGLDMVTVERSGSNKILTLAERHGLTAYDAAYLALALDRMLPLATLDRQFRAAALREGAELLA